jgi:hypothetical protein
MYFPGFDTKQQRDEFFREVARMTRDSLPEKLYEFKDATKPGTNWLKLIYPELLPGSSFELHFSDKSKTHQTHFGSGKLIILAYYFDKKDYLSAWLDAILPYQQVIKSTFGGEVKIAYWGKNNARNYVMIGLKLEEEEYRIDPKRYASTLAKFIRAIFNPVTSATRSVGLM